MVKIMRPDMPAIMTLRFFLGKTGPREDVGSLMS